MTALSRARTNPRTVLGGFTLVELMAVLAIIAILLTMVWPLAELQARREKEHDLHRALWEIRDAIDRYKSVSDAGQLLASTRSGYPASLDVLVAGVPTRAGQTIYFLRRLPSDPFADADSLSPWGLRSSESPASQPAVGADVFDVYTCSTQIGLNGVPLRAW